MDMKRKRTKAQIDADARRTGRPPKAPAKKQSEQVMVYLTKDERKQLEAMAAEKGLSLSAMIMTKWRNQEDE